MTIFAIFADNISFLAVNWVFLPAESVHSRTALSSSSTVRTKTDLLATWTVIRTGCMGCDFLCIKLFLSNSHCIAVVTSWNWTWGKASWRLVRFLRYLFWFLDIICIAHCSVISLTRYLWCCIYQTCITTSACKYYKQSLISKLFSPSENWMFPLSHSTSTILGSHYIVSLWKHCKIYFRNTELIFSLICIAFQGQLVIELLEQMVHKSPCPGQQILQYKLYQVI